MRKYILLVSAVYLPEPVVSARLSADLYDALLDAGKAVRVLHPHPTRPNGFRFDENHIVGADEIIVDSYTCPKSSLLGRFRESISFGQATRKYIEQHHDEIETIYGNTWPLFGQYYLAKAADKYQIPFYIHIHDIYPESYGSKMPRLLGMMINKTFLPIDKYVLKKAEGIICISPSMIAYLSKSRGIDVSKFSLVRNWQEDKAYIESYQPLAKKRKDYHIMYLGSINPTANVTLIIKAFGRLDHSQFRLSILGNGPDKDNCMTMVEQAGLRVSFGTVAPEQVAEVQGTADVLVLCLQKGVAKTATPSKLTAYMLSGRPVIACVDIDSDCASIIQESGCGLVVEPDNEVALSDAIQDLSHKNVEKLNEMGQAGFDYAVNHLSKERNLSKLTNLITQEKK